MLALAGGVGNMCRPGGGLVVCRVHGRTGHACPYLKRLLLGVRRQLALPAPMEVDTQGCVSLT
jgi:hypothetical protein